jgi:D-alanine-D-alanine ligase
VIESYHQPALVEEYLPGREFTVGVLGRRDAFRFSRMPQRYYTDGFQRLPLLEVDSSRSVTPGVYGIAAKSLHYGEDGIPDFPCPALVEPGLAEQIYTLAINAHQAIGALDVSRVDLRLDARGRPRLIEINSLPGLSPGFSDLCVIANAAGISYTELILEILYLGASRYGLLSTPDSLHTFPLEALQPYPRVRETSAD